MPFPYSQGLGDACMHVEGSGGYHYDPASVAISTMVYIYIYTGTVSIHPPILSPNRMDLLKGPFGE